MAPGRKWGGFKQLLFRFFAPKDEVHSMPNGCQPQAGPGGFINQAHGFALHNPTVTSVQGNQYTTNVQGDHSVLPQILSLLSQRIIQGAAHDSSTLTPPPCCPLHSDCIGPNQMSTLFENGTTPYTTAAPSQFSALQTPSGYETTDLARNTSLGSLDPDLPSHYSPLPDGYVAVGGHAYHVHSPSLGPQSPYQRDYSESEICRLRKRVKDLEAIVATTPGSSTPANLSQAFQLSWKRRTEARKTIFCAPNRAGNALCAWHDSRRDRRKYPSRNAPPGMLNCGCSHEEALFEEALARHSIGGYLPGANLRMDPELRAPLLRLLQEHYGYKDGDFDYDPQTMRWHADQDAESWERRAASLSPGARTREAAHSSRHCMDRSSY